MSFPKPSFPQVNRGEAPEGGVIPTVGGISPLGMQPDEALPQASPASRIRNTYSAQSPDGTLAALRDDWLASKSPATETTYRWVFDEYAAWCAGVEVDPLAARRGDVDRYRRWLRNPHRARGVSSETTVAKKLAALSSFYRYAIAESGLMEHSPVEHVDRPRVANITHREGLTAIEARRLLAVSLAAEPMHAALVHLLLSTGMRVSEACSADVTALGRDGESRIITVRRKGGRRARLPLTASCGTALDGHVAGRRDGPLLVTSRGRLSRQEAYRIVHRLAVEVAPDKTIGPHSLRHTAATLAIEAGAPLWRVQAMLDHSDLRTTMRYFHAVDSLQESAVHLLDKALRGEAW